MRQEINNQKELLGGSVLAVVTISAAIFISWQGVMAVPIQIGAVIDGLGISESRSGLLGTIEITTVALVTMLLAATIGQWSKPKVAIVGLAFVVAGQFLSAFTQTFFLLLVWRMTVGIGAGLIYGAACSCIVGISSGDRVFAWGIAFGQIFLAAMLFGLPFASAYGFHQGVFVMLGVTAVLFGILLTKLPDGRRVATDHHDEDSPANVPLPMILWFFVALILFNVAIGMLWGFLERRADELNMDPAQIGTILAALPIGGVLGGMFAGAIGGMFGRLKPLVASLLASAAACVVVGRVDVDIILIIAIFGLGMFELFVVAFMIGTASTMDKVGRLSTLAGGMTLLFYGFGPALGGVLLTYVSASVICQISGIFCLAAAVIALPVGLTLDRRTAHAT